MKINRIAYHWGPIAMCLNAILSTVGGTAVLGVTEIHVIPSQVDPKLKIQRDPLLMGSLDSFH